MPYGRGGRAGVSGRGSISLPGGARLRFDINTTTVALRGVRGSVVRVAGTDTLTLAKTLPAVPVAADTFYLEMPGAVFLSIEASGTIGPSQTGLNYQWLSGLQANGTVAGANRLNISGTWGLAQCWYTGANASSFRVGPMNMSSLYVNVDGTTVDTGGACRSNGSMGMTQGLGFTLLQGGAPGPYCNSLAFTRLGGCVEIESSFVAVGGLTFSGTSTTAKNSVTTTATSDSDPDCIGTSPTNTASGSFPCRILGAGGFAGLLLESDITVCALDVSGCGAKPAVMIRAVGRNFSMGATLTGSAGNTDVGLDLSNAQGCVILLQGTPGVTGTAGDVRLAGGQIASWANLVLGFVDTAGNRFVGVGTSNAVPTVPTTFSGALLGGAAQVTSYLANLGIVGAVNQTTLFQWPSSNRVALILRGNMRANNATGLVTATLLKNGNPTAMQISWGAGVVGSATDRAHPVIFSDTDTYDIQVQNAGADVGKVSSLSVALEWVS